METFKDTVLLCWRRQIETIFGVRGTVDSRDRMAFLLARVRASFKSYVLSLDIMLSFLFILACIYRNKKTIL